MATVMRTATATGTLTINAAFLQEIKDDNRQLQDLLSVLRRLTEIPALPRSYKSLIVDLLSELCDQLAFHFALEEAYGYFEEAVDVAPRVARRADELRAEHCHLFESMRCLAEQAEQWRMNHMLHDHRSAEVLSFRQIVIQFWEFDEQLQQHEASENALVLEAHDTDIGGEG